MLLFHLSNFQSYENITNLGIYFFFNFVALIGRVARLLLPSLLLIIFNRVNYILDRISNNTKTLLVYGYF